MVQITARRLPRGFSHLIVATVYHPTTADDAPITNHVIDILSKIESSMPNAAIIIAKFIDAVESYQVAR